MKHKQLGWIDCVILSLPVMMALWVGFSVLAFAPVPWPDDSAFYLVAKDLFDAPHQWLMLSQAPFESSYGQFNFNTMPLYPLLLGCSRLLGIDGSWGLKVWPLGFWAISQGVLLFTLLQAGLPRTWVLLLAGAFSWDPTLRWASVLVRPESLIGLFGMMLVLGLTLGFPKKWQAQGFWDPVAALLALSAYCHFNAVHLVFAVLAHDLAGLWPTSASHKLRPALQALARHWVRLGLLTLGYLSPWLLLILWHPALFWQQMQVQWSRLAMRDGWLLSFKKTSEGLFSALGNPTPYEPALLEWGTFWMLLLVAGFFASLAAPWFSKRFLQRHTVNHAQQSLPVAKKKPGKNPASSRAQLLQAETTKDVSLIPALGWLLGATWLRYSKPEVWFVYFFHEAVWVACGLSLLKLWRLRAHTSPLRNPALVALTFLLLAVNSVFISATLAQVERLGRSSSWNWKTHASWVACVDERLSLLEKNLNYPKPFRVWGPTFPDILVELSRKHPDWRLTRTNDFSTRNALAIEHGKSVHALVVNETLSPVERWVSGPQAEHPEVQSLWMNWKEYFLIYFLSLPDWKPNRYVCQRGTWQSFLYMDSEPAQE